MLFPPASSFNDVIDGEKGAALTSGEVVGHERCSTYWVAIFVRGPRNQGYLVVGCHRSMSRRMWPVESRY